MQLKGAVEPSARAPPAISVQVGRPFMRCILCNNNITHKQQKCRGMFRNNANYKEFKSSNRQRITSIGSKNQCCGTC